MGDQIMSVGEKLCLGLKRMKPYLAMVSLQFGFAGMYVITMVSLKNGMSHFILAVYRHVVATIVIAPFALVLERKIRPKMTLPVFLRIMVLGFLEPVLDQNLYYLGMKYTSATFASSTVNILPAITFIMAIMLRLERVNLKKMHSLAKVIGTAITVMGAMVMTLYKGPILDIIRSKGMVHQTASNESVTNQHWVTGTIMLLVSCCGWASFFILQTLTLRMYPAELSLTAMICVMGMLEGSVATLIFERDMSVWIIGWDSRLLAVVYSGVVCSGIAYYVQGVVIREKGPVFVTSFSPLCMIITAALGSLVLAEKVHLGSVIGSILIVFGLYTVVWGKSKDKKSSLPSSDDDDEKLTGRELPMVRSTTSIEVDRSSKDTDISINLSKLAAREKDMKTSFDV